MKVVLLYEVLPKRLGKKSKQHDENDGPNDCSAVFNDKRCTQIMPGNSEEPGNQSEMPVDLSCQSESHQRCTGSGNVDDLCLTEASRTSKPPNVEKDTRRNVPEPGP